MVFFGILDMGWSNIYICCRKFRLKAMLLAVALSLTACNLGTYNKSLFSQVQDLKREVQKLRDENNTLIRLLGEIRKRYGIDYEQLKLEPQHTSSLFERVFADDGDGKQP